MFFGHRYTNGVDVFGDASAMEEFGFNRRCSSTHKVVKHKVSRLGVLEDNIAGNIRRPVPPGILRGE